jgi:hypothetical protein
MNASTDWTRSRIVLSYDWKAVWAIVLEHRRELLAANLIAVFAVLASVPLPLKWFASWTSFSPPLGTARCCISPASCC